ncbi:hypothetical protein EYF80_063831 [Liparis tanakae]|uniref:Uncharacterized protein n=1 Tax=Liparis tanakae TaxID=230148 RepID=A0A4Z2EBV5_9TELE|nr:hypothetical protein EYF80_063831 [Liparis tanakae]
MLGFIKGEESDNKTLVNNVLVKVEENDLTLNRDETQEIQLDFMCKRQPLCFRASVFNLY